MTQKEKLDRLAELVKAIGPKRMAQTLVKSENIQIRVTVADKAEIERMATYCGLTVTDYLTRLHYLAKQGLVKLVERQKKGKA